MSSDWVSTLVGALVISSLVALDGWPALHDIPLLLLITGGSLLANLEFARMGVRRNLQAPLTVMQFLAAIVCSLVFYLREPRGSDLVLLVVTILLAFFTLVLTNALLTYWQERSRRELARDFGAALAVALGVSGLLSHAFGLEALHYYSDRLPPASGLRLVLGVLWLAWAAGAGMWAIEYWGRRRLLRAEEQSASGLPTLGAATCAGALAGLLASGSLLSLAPAQGLLLGAAVGLAAFGGRQLVAWLRRFFEVSYTGALFPGLGGFWDRFDTILLAFPVAYYIYRFLLL